MEQSVDLRRSEKLSPILVKKSYISQQRSLCQETQKKDRGETKYEVIGRKSRCQSNWCEICGRRSVNRLSQRLRGYRYDTVRETVVTFDRDLFEDGSEAYDTVSQKKLLSAYIRELRRLCVTIKKYDWILEFHGDGYPHWHVFIDVGVLGKAGMIGNERLLKAWKYGAVYENHFKTEYHWKKKTGYFHKNGYFEKKKGHQSKLPEWALNRRQKIRRYGGTEIEKRDVEVKEKYELVQTVGNLEWDESKLKQEYFEKMMWTENKGNEKSIGQECTNREIIESCGAKTEVLLIISQGRQIEVDSQVVCEFEPKFMEVGTARMSYNDFKRLPGEYLPRIGYKTEMGMAQWQIFYESKILGGEN